VTLLRNLMVFMCLLGIPALAQAQGTQVAFGAGQQDKTLPVEITAENLSVDQTSGTAEFSENVLIVQGEMRLSAARVLVVYQTEDKGIARLEATGGVTLVSGPDAAEAERADYNIDDGTIALTGNVTLAQGNATFMSDRMTVRLDDGTAQMQGRVKTILQPSDK
jgi:lipopolysaccharide export system protein LptA